MRSPEGRASPLLVETHDADLEFPEDGLAYLGHEWWFSATGRDVAESTEELKLIQEVPAARSSVRGPLEVRRGGRLGKVFSL